jgi:CheY-like chemotaxis protein
MKTILLIEDNIEFATKCVEYLRHEKYNVIFCDTTEKAKLAILGNNFEIALIDLMLPPTYNIEGINLFRFIRDKNIDTEVIFMTTKEFKTPKIITEVMKLGARDFLGKSDENFLSELLINIKEIENYKLNISSPIINLIKNQISNLKDITFQDFITELYSIKYENNFLAIKAKRDKGSDGILNKNTILAIYAPEKHNLDIFKKKVKNDNPKSLGDFDKYELHWKNKYPNWQFIYNGIFTSEMTQVLTDLKPDVSLVDINILIRLITNLQKDKLELICNYLKIPDYLIKL